MEEWLEQFLEAPISPAQKMQLFIIVFPYAYWHADAAQAQRLANIVEEHSAPPEAAPLSRIFGALCLLFHATMMGDFPAARDHYMRNIKVAHDFGLGFAVPMLNTFYAHAAVSCGEIEIARQVTSENAVAHTPNTDATSYGHFQILSAMIAAHNGNRSAAVSAAIAFRARIVDTGILHGPMMTSACALLAIALEQAGAIDEARELLTCARNETTTFTNQFPLIDAQLHFVAAACALGAGEEHDALEHLTLGFSIASNKDYAGLIGWSHQLCARLCCEALQRGIEPDYARKLIRRHQLVPASPDIENWPWPVQVYALGRFEVVVDGKPLAYGRKRPARPLALLKFLVAQGARAASETRVADALWPDLDGDEALNSLAINVHRLRRLLGHTDAIVYQDRRIGLNPKRVWTDVAAFESRLGRAASATGNPERGKLMAEAAALYRGDLLPDDDSAPWVIQVRERLLGQFRTRRPTS